MTGAALYTDDLVCRTSTCCTPGRSRRRTRTPGSPACELRQRWRLPGVVRVLTADDVPGINDAGVKHDEPLFPSEVMFYGHAVCWVLGETLEAARLGAAAVEADYEPLPALITVTDAITAGSFQGAQRTGSAAATSSRPSLTPPTCSAASSSSAARSTSTWRPRPRSRYVDESGQVFVQSSTQHPSETQDIVAHVLGLPKLRGHRAVPADGRRLRRQGVPAARARRHRGARRHAHRAPGEPRLNRTQDITMTGKRHPFHATWEGRLRRRRASARPRCHADQQRRLEPGPVRAGAGPRAVPHRQRVLDPRHEVHGRVAKTTRPPAPRSAASAARRA